jgi:hypothetical protein
MTLSPGRARDLARSILSNPPFQPSTHHWPDPLAGFFNTLGRGLRFIFGGFFSWLSHHVFGPVGSAFSGNDGVVVNVLTVVVALMIGAGVGWLLWRRRTHSVASGVSGTPRGALRASASDLEALATAAVADSDYARAVRLWFVAGVERLIEIGVVANGRSRTEHQLRAALDDAVFADLADTHERVVYGEQPATADDAAQAQRGWREVVRTVARRQSARVGAS